MRVPRVDPLARELVRLHRSDRSSHGSGSRRRAWTSDRERARSIWRTCRDSVSTDAVNRHTPELHARSANILRNVVPMPRPCHESSTISASSASVPITRPAPERDHRLGIVARHSDPGFVARVRREDLCELGGGNRRERCEEPRVPRLEAAAGEHRFDRRAVSRRGLADDDDGCGLHTRRPGGRRDRDDGATTR